MNYNYLKKIFLIIIISTLSIATFGQKCKDFHKKGDCRQYTANGFDYYGQSRSAFVEIKKMATFKAVFYGNRDYKVVLCTDYGYYPIHYVIKNADTKEILYDNLEDDYTESVGFTIEKTQNLVFEINVLAEDIEPKDGIDLRVCVGVNIYWRKVPKLGF